MIDPQKEIPELSEEEILRIEEERVNKTSDPFYPPVIDNYCNERVPTDTLTREDILDLGFLRSNPDRFIYRNINKDNIILEQVYQKDYSIKNLIVERVLVYTFDNGILLYDSTKPNKKDIQLIVNSYAE